MFTFPCQEETYLSTPAVAVVSEQRVWLKNINETFSPVFPVGRAASYTNTVLAFTLLWSFLRTFSVTRLFGEVSLRNFIRWILNFTQYAFLEMESISFSVFVSVFSLSEFPSVVWSLDLALVSLRLCLRCSSEESLRLILKKSLCRSLKGAVRWGAGRDDCSSFRRVVLQRGSTLTLSCYLFCFLFFLWVPVRKKSAAAALWALS